MAAIALLAPAPARAKQFANNFLEFQLPENWECKLDGTEWVCQSTDEQKKRDAIIVFAAKARKEGVDELPVYKEHLEKKQVYQAPNGQKVVSEPRYARENQLNGRTWIDSLHLQSEIPDFFTRYLATVESGLGILVTFSVRKDKYSEYSPHIEEMIKTLKAFKRSDDINNPNLGALSPEETGIEIPASFEEITKCKPGEAFNKKTQLCVKRPMKDPAADAAGIAIILLAAAGLGGFLLWRKRRR